MITHKTFSFRATFVACSALLFAALISPLASAVPIDPHSLGLYNTGQQTSAGFDADTGGGIAAQVDDHWYIAGGVDGQTSGPEAFVLQDPPGAWLSNASSPDSVWIAGRAAAEGVSVAGDYNYRIDFDLTGYDPSKVTVVGRFAVDNQAAINLNNSPTGIVQGGFSAWIPFAISSGFVSGANTLEFLVNNAAVDPMGLRVEFTAVEELPEPASIIPAALGFLGLLGWYLRRRVRG